MERPLCPYCGDGMTKDGDSEAYTCISCGCSTLNPNWTEDEEPTEAEMDREFKRHEGR